MLTRINFWHDPLRIQSIRMVHILFWALECLTVFLTKHISELTNRNLTSTPNR